MEPITAAIIAALTAGAASDLTEAAKKAISDGYSGLKALINEKFVGKDDVTDAVEKLEAQPESPGRQQTLAEELKAANAAADPELLGAAHSLLELIKAMMSLMRSRDEAERLIEKRESDLLADLGSDLLGRGAVPAAIEVKIKVARGWLRENEGRIKNCVCTERVQALVKADAGPIEICVAVGDLLLEQFAHVAPLSLAALLVKAGIRSYCEKTWNGLAGGEKRAADA